LIKFETLTNFGFIILSGLKLQKNGYSIL